MDWKELLTILIPTLGFLAWVYNRLDKKFDKMEDKFNKMEDKFDKRFEEVDKRFEKVDKQFEKMYDVINEIKKDTYRIEMRITRLEGQFDERGYWESRKTGTHDEK